MTRRRVSILLAAFLFITVNIVSYAGEPTQAELVTLDEDGGSADQGGTSEDGDSSGENTGEDSSGSSSGDESAVGDTSSSESTDSSDAEPSAEGTGNVGASGSTKSTEATENSEAGSAASEEDGIVQTGDEGTASSDNLSADADVASENANEGPYQLIYDINIADSIVVANQERELGENESAESVADDHTRYILDQVFETGSTEQVLSVEEAFPALEDLSEDGMGYTDQYRKFVYWSTEPDGSGATLDPAEDEEVVFTDHDIILYAVWTKMDLTMSVDKDGDGSYDDDGAEAVVGDELTYCISYTNNYDYAVSLSVTEVLDEGLTFALSDTGSYDEETNTLTWYLDVVESGTGGSLDFTAAVNENAVKDNEITGSASVRVDSYSAVTTNQVKNWVPLELTISAIWEDNEDREKIRPESLQVQLQADGKALEDPVKLNEGNSWSYTWKDLPRYADGREITYTIESDPVEGYEQTCGELTDNGGGTYSIQLTNEFVSATIKVSGSVTWDDVSEEEDFSRKRPEEVIIHLFADGNKVRNLTLTEEDGWEWTFSGLNKYDDDGIEITYTVTEDTVKDYVTLIDGYEIVNSYSPYKVNLNIQLIFDDKDNEDSIRPESVVVDLLENSEKTGDTLTLDGSNGWSAGFTDLDMYINGEDIDYTVEVSPIDGYKTFLSEERDTNCILLQSVRMGGSEVETEDDLADNAAETGDDTPVGFLTGLMLVAAAIMLAEVQCRRRKRNIVSKN